MDQISHDILSPDTRKRSWTEPGFSSYLYTPESLAVHDALFSPGLSSVASSKALDTDALQLPRAGPVEYAPECSTADVQVYFDVVSPSMYRDLLDDRRIVRSFQTPPPRALPSFESHRNAVSKAFQRMPSWQPELRRMASQEDRDDGPHISYANLMLLKEMNMDMARILKANMQGLSPDQCAILKNKLDLQMQCIQSVIPKDTAARHAKR
jgi:hypothetical protein